jgi:uncharacterized protein DUF4926
MDMTPHLYDRVELVVALPDEPYAGGHPPAAWHGLAPGDRGAVVEIFDTPPGYIVEFFRDGKTVAVSDVTPEQIRVIARHSTSRTPETAQRTAD